MTCSRMGTFCRRTRPNDRETEEAGNGGEERFGPDHAGIKAIYRPFLSLCLTYASSAVAQVRAQKCAHNIAERNCIRTVCYIRIRARAHTYGNVTTRNSFARPIKQVIIIAEHPIFARSRERSKIASRRGGGGKGEKKGKKKDRYAALTIVI